MNESKRRYAVELGLAMLAYLVVLNVSIRLIQANPQSQWRYALAVTPVIPALFALFAFIRYLGRADELQRRIQLDAIAFSFAATGILTFTYGFLENVGFPRLSYILILPVMVLLWGIGTRIASWRYR